MERKSWLCLDCHAVFYDGENHLCWNFHKSHFKSTRQLRHKRTEGIRRSISHVQYNGGGQIEALNNLAAFSSSSDIHFQLPTENLKNVSDDGNSYLKAQEEEHPNLHVPKSSKQNMFDLSLEAGYPVSLRGTEAENSVDSECLFGMQSYTSDNRHESTHYSNTPGVSILVSDIKNYNTESSNKKIKLHNYELTPILHEHVYQNSKFSGRACSEEYSLMSGLNMPDMPLNIEPFRPESREEMNERNISLSTNILATNSVLKNFDMVPVSSFEDENETRHLQSLPHVISQTSDNRGNKLDDNDVLLVSENDEYHMAGPAYGNDEAYCEFRDGRFICRLCEKSYSSKYHFQIHFRIHTGERPYACDKCSKRFITNGHLTRHLQLHSEKRPYPCNMCEKRFFSQFDLDNHQGIHSVERPYDCHLCTHRFKELWRLNIHLRTHTGEKPYPCDMCDKRFAHKYYRDKHRQTHNGN